MNMYERKRVGSLQSLVARFLGGWWLVAALASVWALFAFPLYKGMVLGLVPVLLGVATALGARKLPRRLIDKINRGLENSSSRTWLTTVLLIGLALRTVAIAFPPIAISDHALYLEVGRRVAGGNGFGDLIFWPPGQPTVVALAIWLVGDEVHHLAAFHAGLGLLTVALLYLGLRKYSEAAARWSSLVASVWPSVVLWNSTLGHETVTTLLFVAIMLMIFRMSEGTARSHWTLCALTGLLTGLMALVRPTALAIPVLMVIALWMRGQNLWRCVAQAAVVAFVMVSAIAPWTLRNYQKFDEFCPISANAGNVLLSSNHPESDGVYHGLPHIPELKPCERDRLRSRQAWAAIAADPVRFAAFTVKRIAFMWGTDTSGLDFILGDPPRGGDKAKKMLSFVMQVPWAFLVTAWAVSAWRGRAVAPGQGHIDWTFVIFWTGLLWLVHALVEPLSRHHLPLIPLIAAIVLPAYWRWVTTDDRVTAIAK